ncbi:MAG TPA: PadR family transcriptional regulator [Bryobacteraceae bacterium]|nr:PadR family transcriptional regulator [Bryobacteraceae bacterium]
MPKKPEQLLPLNEGAYLIMASLAEPCHGYGIMQEVAALDAGGLKLGPGTLYTALGKLTDQGLIRPMEASGEGDRRKLYRLTPLGLEVLILENRRLAALAEWGRKRLLKTGVKL